MRVPDDADQRSGGIRGFGRRQPVEKARQPVSQSTDPIGTFPVRPGRQPPERALKAIAEPAQHRNQAVEQRVHATRRTPGVANRDKLRGRAEQNLAGVREGPPCAAAHHNAVLKPPAAPNRTALEKIAGVMTIRRSAFRAMLARKLEGEPLQLLGQIHGRRGVEQANSRLGGKSLVDGRWTYCGYFDHLAEY